MKTSLLLTATAIAGLVNASASVFVTNLGNTSTSSDTALAFAGSSQVKVAQMFTVGVDDATLTGVTLNIGTSIPGGTFHVDLFSDASGVPGTSLTTLSGSTTPSGNSTYTPAGSVPLTNGSSYWVVAYNVSAGFSGYNVNETSDLSASTLGGWALGGVSTFSGGSWAVPDTAKHALIQITAVPEPAETAGLIGLALAGFALWRKRQD